MSQETITRFAPSPTGFLHIGGLRTALFNFLYARKHNGKFILRIEDTDRARLVPGALENITQTLKDFNLNFDEGPILQSQRLSEYRKHAEGLVKQGAAYYCFCSTQRLEELRASREAQKLPPKYDKHCLNLSAEEIKAKLDAGGQYVIRLNVPANQTIRFTDLVHGEISVSTNDLDDQVLLKSDGYPTYHMAVVVDDHQMNITHVIRGEEWIPSTPKHILLYSAFGWESPQHVHLPLLLSKTRKKLSKRDGDVAVKDFLDQGYLPEALLNFVAFLGWNPKSEQEIFNLRELIDEFAVEKINKAGAVFDPDKLDWFNSQYIRKMDISELTYKILPFMKKAGIDFENYSKEFTQKIILLERDRLKKLSEIGERVRYFFQEPQYDSKILLWKNTSKAIIIENLKKISEFLESIPYGKFQKDFLETEIKKFIAENNLKNGEVLWPLRVSLSGLEASPGPFEIMDAFGSHPEGKEIISKRINKAVELLDR